MKCEMIQDGDMTICARVFADVFNAPPWSEGWSVSAALARLTEISRTPGFVGMKAVEEGQIQGFAMGYLESFDSGTDFYLKEMCVLPDVQRKSIGTALLAALKEELASKGARKLYLLTSRDGPAARFYAKNGFHTSDKMIMMGLRLEPRK